jgi:hypothetical protein
LQDALATLAQLLPPPQAPLAGASGSTNVDAAVVCGAVAQRCVDRVAAGRAALAQLEGCLLQLLSAVLQPLPATPGSGGEQTGDPAQDATRGRLREGVLLLCGAALHAWLKSECVESAVWRFDRGTGGRSGGGSGDAGVGSGGGASELPVGLQSFVQLPVQLMRAVRAGCSLGVLRRLRLWLQDATLGGAECE